MHDLVSLWEDNKDWIIPTTSALIALNAGLLRYSSSNLKTPTRGKEVGNALKGRRFKQALKLL